jgi:chaperonin GroES
MIEAKKNNVFVEVLIRTKTAGGIVIPESAKDPQGYGRVLSVGGDVEAYKVGDIVVHHPNGGMSVLLGKKLYIVLKEDDIYGVLTDKELLETLNQPELNIPEEKEESKLVRV